jgi:amino acid adenylation domain-containing protein
MSELEFDPFAGSGVLERVAPATESQKELWTASRLGTDASCAYNESVTLSFAGELDVDALRRACRELVARHDALRSTFSPDGETICVHAAGDDAQGVLALFDWSEDPRLEQLVELQRREVEQAFDLEKGPLVRFRLAKLGARDWHLVITAHHIVCDGWSMAVLVKELGALYEGRQLAPAASFCDFAARQEIAPEAEAYWLGQFASLPPLLALPLDKPRPPRRTFNSRRVDVALEPELIAALRKTARSQQTSFFVLLLGAFQTYLARITGQDDLVVGIPTAGQAAEGDDGTSLVGHCVNFLPLRSRVKAGASLGEHLESLRKSVFAAYENQAYTLGRLLQKLPLPRDPSRQPLLSVCFNVDQGLSGGDLRFCDVAVKFASNPRSFEAFELFLNLTEASGEFVIECQYNAELFEEEGIRRRLEGFAALLRAHAAEPSALASRRAPIMSEAELRLVTETFNQTEAPYSSQATLHELVLAAAVANASRTAIIQGDESMSYAELGQRSSRVAQALVARGVRPGDRVGLAVDRNLDLVPAMLGILRAGAAYVPLDPAYPDERLQFMREDAELAVVLVSRSTQERMARAMSVCLVVVDELAAADSDVDVALPAVTPAELAYVIYTSGSTGRPKGVLVEHASAVNLIEACRMRPGVGVEDRVLLTTTISFDIHVFEIFTPLLAGATLGVATRDEARDGRAVAGLVERHGVTLVQGTPSFWRLVTPEIAGRKRRLKGVSAGEPLTRELATAMSEAGVEVWNGYGPTEATVYTTFERVDAGDVGPVLIGRPVQNMRCYVLDEQLAPVPIGVVGELWIGGIGVARGYRSRPELTDERFQIIDVAGPERLYRSGDLARWTSEGRLECLGRVDQQVKVRGFRIELGEIEAVLGAHPAVELAAVTVRTVRAGDARIVAYYQAKTPVPAAELRAHAQRSLPEFMIPQAFVELASMPLTGSGKIDRNELPVLDVDGVTAALEEAYVEPNGALETLLAQLWAEALGCQRVSATADFFELGGHSLLAAQILSRLSRDHGINLPLRTIFEGPTVRALAARAEAATQKGPEAIRRRDLSVPAPLTHMQRRCWYVEQLRTGNTIYNLPAAWRAFGPIDMDALCRAFAEFSARHEAVRTRFAWQDGDLVQLVDESLGCEPVLVDLRAVDKVERERIAKEDMSCEAEIPFDPMRGPLLRAKIFRMTDEETIVFIMPHHAIWDGWCFDLFTTELSSLYDAFAKRLPLPARPELHYGDYAAWHEPWLRSERFGEELSYWRNKLERAPVEIALPTDRPRPSEMSYEGRTIEWMIPQAQVERLERLGRRVGATFNMVMIAALKALLSRSSGQSDILIGSPIRGRTHPQTEEMIGFFVNTLVLRSDLGGNPSFLELLQRIRATSLDAYTHEHVPFDLLVNELKLPRDPSRHPLVQIFFTFQDVRNRVQGFGDLPFVQEHVHTTATPLDLNIWVKQLRSGVVAGFNYATDLFDEATIQRLIGHYMNILEQVAASPETRLDDLELMAAEERRSVLEGFNATQRAYQTGVTLGELIEARVAEAPERAALIFDPKADGTGSTLSYGELNGRVNRLARLLRARGVGRGSFVGVSLERGLDLWIAMLAVVKAGGAYVPLDPGYPAERIRFTLEDADLGHLITRSSLGAPLSNVTLIDLDADQAAIDAQSDRNLTGEAPELDADEGSVAYVIYTSGTTGRPKGSLIPHRSVVNLVQALARWPGLAAGDRVLAQSTVAFDMSIPDIFLTLTSGATTVLAPRDAALDGRVVIQLLERYAVNFMQGTPSTWRLMLDAGWRGSPDFKVIAGGEALPKDLAEKLLDRCASLWNGYGPTETTVYTTFYQVKREGLSRPMLIGRPIDNVRVYILDARRRPVPVGTPGEIYVAGAGVSLGYLKRPQMTADKFVADPFVPGLSMYRTGDLGRFAPDGQIEYLGRNDTQVKVRGFRIELAEIEAALLAQPGVQAGVVSVHEETAGDARLVAYFVAEDAALPSVAELRRGLKDDLPEHMIPQIFMRIDALPLSPTGKVDRLRLPAPVVAVSDDELFVEPSTPTERALATIWVELLKVERASAGANFFELGGHSLLSMQMLARIEERLGVRLNPIVVMMNTLGQIAAEIDARKLAPVDAPKRSTGFFGRVFGRGKA